MLMGTEETGKEIIKIELIILMAIY